MKRVVTVLWTLFIVFTIVYGLFQLTKSRTFQLFGELVSSVETDQKVIALTFDDAPTEHSNQVVDILKEKDVKATFYVIGQNIEKYPNEAKYIIENGHELGNHSYSHKRFVLKTLPFIREEIESTNDLIKNLGYNGEITFRPPTGKKFVLLPWYLQRNNIKTIMWDVEPDTFHPGDKEAIVDFTLENTKSGSIILLHPFCGDQCKADREALPVIIDELTNRGFQFVTVSELMKYKN